MSAIQQMLLGYGGTGGGGDFSPLSLPGLAGWYDATDPDTIVLGDSSVASWLDKSSAARDMAGDSIEANRPIVGSKSGRVVLATPPSNIFRATFADFTFPAGAGYVFAVTYRASAAIGSLLLSSSSGAYRSAPFIQTPSAYFFDAALETSIDFPSDTDLHVVGMRATAGGRSHYVDETTTDATEAWGPVIYNSLGWPSGGSASTLRGGIGELIFGSGALSTTEASQLLSYLRAKWGTP